MANETKKDAVTAKVGPAQYVAQVRQELRKVTWPTPRETYVTTILVLIMVVLMGAFFFLVDWVLANGIQALISLGS